jgi:hypothetical protein
MTMLRYFEDGRGYALEAHAISASCGNSSSNFLTGPDAKAQRTNVFHSTL